MKQLYKGEIYKSKYSEDRIIVIGYLLNHIEEYLSCIFILTKDVVFENYLGDLYKTKQLNELWENEVHYLKKDFTSQEYMELVTKSAFNKNDYVYEKNVSEQEVDNLILKLQLVGKIDNSAKYVNKEHIELFANDYINNYYSKTRDLIEVIIEKERYKFNRILKERTLVLDKNKITIPNMGYLMTTTQKFLYLYSSRGVGYDKKYVYLGRADKEKEEDCFKLYLKTVCFYNYKYILEGKKIDLKDIKGKEIIDFKGKFATIF